MREIAKETQQTAPANYPALLDEVQKALTDNMWEIEQGNVSEAERREKIMAFLHKQVEDKKLSATPGAAAGLVRRFYNDTQRFSILTPYLDDVGVEGIHINSWRDIRVKYTDGRSVKVQGFNNPQHAIDIVRRLLQESKVTMDGAVPIGEASVNSVIRVEAVQDPIVSPEIGVACYIRKLRDDVFTMKEYVENEFATPEMLNAMQTYIRRGLSALFVGKVNTGKTTLVKHVLDSLPDEMEIVTIESGAREMNLVHSDAQGNVSNNVIHMLTRESDIEKQDITQERLIVVALRLNPDILSVAEVRDIEAHSAVEASLSGHTVVSTTHAGGVKQGHHRVATLARKKYGTDMASAMLDACEAFPIVAFIHTTEDNRRRIMNISECFVDGTNQVHYSTLWEFRVRENRKTENGVVVVGEYVQVNDPSEPMVAKMKLWGVTSDELRRLRRKKEEGK